MPGHAVLVNPYDVASIRQGVMRVVRDEQPREELIHKGLRNIERFRPKIIAAQCAALYEELVACCSSRRL